MKQNMRILAVLAILMLTTTAFGKKKADETVIVAYVTSWTNEVPDPSTMTHINYAFGHVNDTFNGVRIDNPDRLRMIVGLKAKNPALKVMLSVGGWGSGRFSEMAATTENRMAFAKDCKSKEVICYNCQEMGHMASQCTKPKKTELSKALAEFLFGDESALLRLICRSSRKNIRWHCSTVRLQDMSATKKAVCWLTRFVRLHIA